MSDAIHSVKANADVLRAIIVTRFFNLEGNIHFPRLGKEARRLSNMLNSDRKFIAMTDVQIINRVNGTRDPKIYPFIEINTEAIEFIQPHMDAREAEREVRESGQSNIS